MINGCHFDATTEQHSSQLSAHQKLAPNGRRRHYHNQHHYHYGYVISTTATTTTPSSSQLKKRINLGISSEILFCIILRMTAKNEHLAFRGTARTHSVERKVECLICSVLYTYMNAWVYSYLYVYITYPNRIYDSCNAVCK